MPNTRASDSASEPTTVILESAPAAMISTDDPSAGTAVSPGISPARATLQRILPPPKHGLPAACVPDQIMRCEPPDSATATVQLPPSRDAHATRFPSTLNPLIA